MDFTVAFASAIVSTALAVVVSFQARRSMTRWAFVGGMLLLALEGVCSGIAARQTTGQGMIAWQTVRVFAASLLPGIWLLFSLGYSRGNAAEFRTRWRYAVVAALGVPLILTVGLRSGLFSDDPAATLPAHWPYQLSLPGVALYVLLLLGAVLVLVQLERTYRAAVGTMRWRIKFMLMGLGLLFLVRLYTSSQAIVFRALDPNLQTVNAGAAILACALMTRSLIRSGHFEKDVYPSHAVIFNSLTFLLAGIYLLAVGAIAQLLPFFGDEGSYTLKAFLVLLALVGLAVLLQSDHFRQAMRQFVSRNFQRPTYDYRDIWRRFTSETSSEADPSERYAHLARLVADVFAALSVTIWRFEDGDNRLTLAASTSVSDHAQEATAPTQNEARELSAWFRAHPEPVAFETSPASWAALLRRCHPREFPHGGARVCVPLVARGEPHGVIVLGDRVNGTPFSAQDFDMLKSIGEHVGASLLADRFAARLLQMRELEAFQAMATFFVHDLKNVATTLNLMVKNLPVHFDDPEFRSDALRGIAKTGTQINNMIARLDHLRKGLQIRRINADLNAIVQQSLDGWRNHPGIALTVDLADLPPLALDPEQISKVVTNLVINAVEACDSGGSVRVSTRSQDRWAVLALTDDGCGMSEEFMNHSLFRAFQTSKKNGLGIGMYQSKMIVEAHQGRIAVQSSPGAGTAFEVFLPLTGTPAAAPAGSAVEVAGAHEPPQ